MMYLNHVMTSGDQRGVQKVVVRVSHRAFDFSAKKRSFSRSAWNNFIKKGQIMIHDFRTKCYRTAAAHDLH